MLESTDGRECTKCHLPKKWEEFSIQSNGKNGRSSVCKWCRGIQAKFTYKKSRKKLTKDERKLKLHRIKAALSAKQMRDRLRLEVMEVYGASRCGCCSEPRIEFLVIDHIQGGGDRHRLSIGCKTGGHTFYAKLKRLGFPFKDELRVLCQNCNASYGFYGYCPHEKGR